MSFYPRAARPPDRTLARFREIAGMQPDLRMVHAVLRMEQHLAAAERERRSALFQLPTQPRVSALSAAIRRVAASLVSLLPVRGQHLVEVRPRVVAADCVEPASRRPC